MSIEFRTVVILLTFGLIIKLFDCIPYNWNYPYIITVIHIIASRTFFAGIDKITTSLEGHPADYTSLLEEANILKR